MTSTKRLVVKVFVAVVIIIVTALTLVAIFSLLPHPMPTFNFLNGQRPLQHVKNKPYRIDTYSFKADINDIHKKAEVELTSLGYTERIPTEREIYFRQWELHDRFIMINFRDNWRLQVVPGSSPNRYRDNAEDGWVTVQVIHKRR